MYHPVQSFFFALKNSEIFIAGAKFDKTLEPFAVRVDEIDMVQYGSDDTKLTERLNIFLAPNIMIK